MPTSQQPGGKSNAVAWFATCMTLGAGVVTCTIIGFAVNADMSQLFKFGGPIMAGVLFLWWLVRDPQPGSGLSDRWGWLKRKPKPAKKAQVRLVRAKEAIASNAPSVPVGGPPTAESIRELKGGVNTWVPSNNRQMS